MNHNKLRKQEQKEWKIQVRFFFFKLFEQQLQKVIFSQKYLPNMEEEHV